VQAAKAMPGATTRFEEGEPSELNVRTMSAGGYDATAVSTRFAASDEP
jgi:hypothetical protein